MSFKIVIVTVGSRGDVQPYLALGKALFTAGYEITVATHHNFQDSVLELGLDYSPVAGNTKVLMQSPIGQKFVETGGASRFVSDQLLTQMMKDSYKACLGANLIVYNTLSAWIPSIAKKLGIRTIYTACTPVINTGDYPLRKWTPPAKFFLKRWWNTYTYLKEGAKIWQDVKSPVSQFREELNIPKYSYLKAVFKALFDSEVKKNPPHYISAISPSVVPRATDWPDYVHQTGYWFLDFPDYQPPQSLLDFLAAGEPPLCIGFSSIFEQSGKLIKTILDFLEACPQRVIFLSGWSKIDQSLPPNCLMLEAVPHHWLFPRVKGVIHHGGAGTTAAALRAGIPQIIISHFGDQVFWGDLITLKQWGYHIPLKQLTKESLIQESTVFEDSDVQQQVKMIAQQIHQENGLIEAVQVIEKFLNN